MKGFALLASLVYLGTAEDKVYDATFSWNDDAWKRFESGYHDMQNENLQVHKNLAKEAHDEIQQSYLKAKGETELVFGKICTPLGKALDRYKKWGQVNETCDTQCALEICLNQENWTFDEDCVRHTCECRLVNPNPNPESVNYDPQELDKFNQEVGAAHKAGKDYVSSIFEQELELHRNLTEKYEEAKAKIEANQLEFIRKQLKNIASCNNPCVNKCTNPHQTEMDDLPQCLDSCDCELTAVDFTISQRNPAWNPETLLEFNQGDRQAWASLMRRTVAVQKLGMGDVTEIINYMPKSRSATIYKFAFSAFESSTHNKEAAKKISDACKNQYGGSWVAIVGGDWGSYVYYVNNNYLLFKIGDTKVLVFQSDY